MKFIGEFRKEYLAKLEEDGCKLNGQVFVQIEKDLYIEWLETKIQNTSDNSDYAKCQHDYVDINGCVKYMECTKCGDKLI